jgi:hypothetical protein
MIGTVGGIFPHVAVGGALADAVGAVVWTGPDRGGGLAGMGTGRDEGATTRAPASRIVVAGSTLAV